MSIRTTYDAIAAIEGFDGLEHDRENIIEAFQLLISSGVVWTLQGCYGRAAKSLIESGDCHR